MSLSDTITAALPLASPGQTSTPPELVREPEGPDGTAFSAVGGDTPERTQTGTHSGLKRIPIEGADSWEAALRSSA
jgi:hypothetical protein